MYFGITKIALNRIGIMKVKNIYLYTMLKNQTTNK